MRVPNPATGITAFLTLELMAAIEKSPGLFKFSLASQLKYASSISA
jgi:hypothetical protein